MPAIRKNVCMLIAALFVILSAPSFARAAELNHAPQAAFIRDNNLWVQSAAEEKQLTQGAYVRNPKWSHDGQWIAYTKGENEQELWAQHVKSGKAQLVSSSAGSSFAWSPERNMLAYLNEGRLLWVQPKKPEKPVLAAEHIGNFSWMPDGKGFLASSESKLEDQGWRQISLLEIPLKAKGDPSRFKTLYVLPKQSDDFFAVGTSTFKWSHDGRWIAFLATPTASLSADSNTLCLLSSDGAVFKKVDQMVRNEAWFQWAPGSEALAWIGGIGREATTNKQLKVISLSPQESAPVIYTPQGFVDQSFTWLDDSRIVVSRAKETERFPPGGLSNAPLPFLSEVNLSSSAQPIFPKPPETFGDFNPVLLPGQGLSWVRSNRTDSSVMLSGTDGEVEEWIPRIDAGANFYGQWNWASVLQFFTRRT